VIRNKRSVKIKVVSGMEGYHSDEDEEDLGGQVISSINETDNEDWYISEKLIKQKTNVDS
jgi:hypothetical protein